MKASILLSLCAMLSGAFASDMDDAELAKRQPDIRAQCLLGCEKLHVECIVKRICRSLDRVDFRKTNDHSLREAV